MRCHRHAAAAIATALFAELAGWPAMGRALVQQTGGYDPDVDYEPKRPTGLAGRSAV